jgi:hypothetical protein
MRTVAAVALLLVWSVSARARGEPQPPASPPPPPPALPPPPAPALPPPSSETPAQPSAPLVLYVAPPAPPVRAPKYALWLGGRLGVIAYGGGLYLDNRTTGDVETTGNFVRPGLALEVDVGARLAKRYIPYVAIELGVMGAGHRFDGTAASATTTFVGAGFRYLAGDPDDVAFLGDVSFGFRKVQVSSGGMTWSASGLEIFRLGFGVEARITRQLTVSPAITLSGGTLTDTSGSVRFGPVQGDGQTGPLFVQGAPIPQSDQASYFAVVIGCGVHADLLGK